MKFSETVTFMGELFLVWSQSNSINYISEALCAPSPIPTPTFHPTPARKVWFTVRTWQGFCSLNPGLSLPEDHCQNMSKALFPTCSQLAQIPVRFRENRLGRENNKGCREISIPEFRKFSVVSSLSHVAMSVWGKRAELKGELFDFYSYLEVWVNIVVI